MQRENSIIVRNDETNVIKILSIYAKDQGSKSPEKLYMVYTKLVYKTLNIESGLRGHLNSSQLSVIVTAEIMIAQTVIQLMKDNVHYKLIYQTVKNKLKDFVGLISISEIYSVKSKQYTIGLAS